MDLSTLVLSASSLLRSSSLAVAISPAQQVGPASAQRSPTTPTQPASQSSALQLRTHCPECSHPVSVDLPAWIVDRLEAPSPSGATSPNNPSGDYHGHGHSRAGHGHQYGQQQLPRRDAFVHAVVEAVLWVKRSQIPAFLLAFATFMIHFLVALDRKFSLHQRAAVLLAAMLDGAVEVEREVGVFRGVGAAISVLWEASIKSTIAFATNEGPGASPYQQSQQRRPHGKSSATTSAMGGSYFQPQPQQDNYLAPPIALPSSSSSTSARRPVKHSRRESFERRPLYLAATAPSGSGAGANAQAAQGHRRTGSASSSHSIGIWPRNSRRASGSYASSSSSSTFGATAATYHETEEEEYDLHDMSSRRDEARSPESDIASLPSPELPSVSLMSDYPTSYQQEGMRASVSFPGLSTPKQTPSASSSEEFAPPPAYYSSASGSATPTNPSTTSPEFPFPLFGGAFPRLSGYSKQAPPPPPPSSPMAYPADAPRRQRERQHSSHASYGSLAGRTGGSGFLAPPSAHVPVLRRRSRSANELRRIAQQQEEELDWEQEGDEGIGLVGRGAGWASRVVGVVTQGRIGGR